MSVDQPYMFDAPEHRLPSPKPKPTAAPPSCCVAAAEADHLAATLHHLCHSRTPFSPAQLADLADVDLGTARRALRDQPGAYVEATDGLYVGRLRPERRGRGRR